MQYLNLEVKHAGGYAIVANGSRIKGVPVFRTAAMARNAMLNLRGQFRRAWNHSVNMEAGVEDKQGNPI
jgi:hypothetical protein